MGHITAWEEDYKGNNTSPSLQSPLANSWSPSCTCDMQAGNGMNTVGPDESCSPWWYFELWKITLFFSSIQSVYIISQKEEIHSIGELTPKPLTQGILVGKIRSYMHRWLRFDSCHVWIVLETGTWITGIDVSLHSNAQYFSSYIVLLKHNCCIHALSYEIPPFSMHFENGKTVPPES
jgi:hypothetical protein